MAFGRKLVVDDEEYRYKVGRSNVIIQYGKQKIVVSLPTLSGSPWIDVENSQHKRSFHITPKMVAAYIRNGPPNGVLDYGEMRRFEKWGIRT